MATTLPIPQSLKDMWSNTWEQMSDFLTPPDAPTSQFAPGELRKVGEGLTNVLGMTKKPEGAFSLGMLNLTPGYIATNFRSPEVIQELRRVMTEEMKSRGPIGTVLRERVARASQYSPEVILSLEPELINAMKTGRFSSRGTQYTESVSDPIDQILRGSWYHGMSKVARETLLGETPEWHPGLLEALQVANVKGFPISHHDAFSMSNRLGEPSGVSLSMLPTKTREFSADEFIHRVLPLYKGSPTERIVNLMTPEGRKALNDAYDVVMNKQIDVSHIANIISPGHGFYPSLENIDPFLSVLPSGREIGPFNQALSQQLQSSGYRGLLYNPRRWNEYEMLMLDPKYVLPLDYRNMIEYAHPAVSRYLKTRGSFSGGPLSLEAVIETATPGIQKGVSQIQDLMSSNASRLGDIYSERHWSQRLSEENKDTLLQLIDPQYREQIVNQLFGR